MLKIQGKLQIELMVSSGSNYFQVFTINRAKQQMPGLQLISITKTYDLLISASFSFTVIIIIIIIIASPAKLRKGKVAESKGKVKKSTLCTVHKEHFIVLSSGESDSDEQVGFIGIHVLILILY